MVRSEVFFEDCKEGLARFPDGWFKLAIIDPPYGIGEAKKRRGVSEVAQRKSRRSIKLKASDYKQQDWDSAPPDQQFFDQLFRVAQKVIIWGENYLSFAQKDSSSGRIVWDKVNGDNDFSDCEIAWTNIHRSVRKLVYMWNGMMQGKSMEEPDIPQPNKRLNEKRIQAGQKPVILYKMTLRDYASPGDNILSTHCGSGSDRIAAWDMGFDFTGFENDFDNYNGQEKRFENHVKQLDLFSHNTYIYAPNVSVATKQHC